jgi:hypothetical protein
MMDCSIMNTAHTTNCRLQTQEKRADYLYFLKGNQPNAPAKARQLLGGSVSPLSLSRSMRDM